MAISPIEFDAVEAGSGVVTESDLASHRRELAGYGRQLQTVVAGVKVGESPRWHDGRLYYCDWGAQEVVALDDHAEREVMARTPSFPFCVDWLPDGRLLIVLSREGLVLSREADDTLSTYADLTGLSNRPWNDIVVDRDGNAYVNNLGFDFPFGEFSPGLLAAVHPDGSVQQLADDLAFPNGMVLSPDGSTLILAESYANRLTAFTATADGTISDRRVWADLGGGIADGICLDAEGAVWYGDPQGRCVRVREGGHVLQTIDLDTACFACALGGPDGKTLFMMANQMPPDFTARSGAVLAATVSVGAAANES
jgi:sugar lactone lactonase YvrE